LTIRNFINSGYTKSLVTLCAALLLTACGSDDGGVASAPGTVTVSWSAPLARADGSGLTMGEIAGYRVYYSATEGVYSNLVDVTDSATLQGVVAAPSGTYFIVVTAYDLEGRESQFSSPAVEVTIL